MSRIEERARKIVRDAYFDYLDSVKTDTTHFYYDIYSERLEMLKLLFPKTTNEYQLERTWYAMYRKLEK